MYKFTVDSIRARKFSSLKGRKNIRCECKLVLKEVVMQLRFWVLVSTVLSFARVGALTISVLYLIY